LFNKQYCFIIDERVQLLLPILILVLLVYLIYRLDFFRLDGLPAWASPVLFLIKLCFGFALWAVYTFYYTDRSTSDIYKFYNDAHYVHLAYSENKAAFTGLMTGSEDSSLKVYTDQMKNWERNFNKAVPFNENRFMIRLNALMMFISGENIHVHTIIFCFLSFIGCISLLKLFQYFLEEEKKKWAVLTILFPSFLFWTSGGLKESLIILGLGLFLYGFLFLRQRGLAAVVLLLSGLALLLVTKYFLLICLLPALSGYYLFINKESVKQVFFKYAGIIIVTIIVLAAIAPIDKRTNFARIISKKQKYAVGEAKYMKAGSYSEVPVVDSTIVSVVAQLPAGLWDSMMKPYLWQSKNPMMLLSAAENMVILLLLILAIAYRDKKKTYDYNLLLFCCLSLVLYFSIIGIMTPVLGNLVRYKVILIPLLIFVLLYVTDIKKCPYQKS
jgi:hypothetical protein